ncbi:hypothetical protein [Pedobacter alluvionis]|uniref:VWFA domain-containing protein n=1 Tax=Pedobacter alluvionis TaxID=475253 RepID=A0A497Y0X8_9SPHI|nr:hypothetical protein [Pedobacter alluvionis]RLJ73700.1 hypothetical protein BCL90_3863 [Pedobacter alluvionis]TFB32677.1 hypothetical protein E3V97_01175 [Pedobacter alluvionis]
MKSTLLKILIPLLITAAFAKEGKAQPAQQNLNISFLLDLSDRIDPKKNPDLYQRDLGYIKSIETAFVNHVKEKKMMLLNDQMQVFFDPIPKIPNINQLSQQLKVSFNPKTSKKDILSVDNTYTQISSKIYQHTIKYGRYIGSDIWKFFKNNVQDYCIKPGHRNILVILTDGYMYHANSIIVDGGKSSYITPEFLRSKKLNAASYQAVMKKNNLGFIAFPYNLKELEIIVLGINPSIKNPYEEDVIKQYWADWFKAMKVKKYELRPTDLAANLAPVIDNFIKGKP